MDSRIETLLEGLVDASVAERLLISVAALVFAVVVGAVIVLVSGIFAECREVAFVAGGTEFCYNPLEVYWVMLVGAFGSATNLGVTLQETTLLIFTGLSVAVAFRAGLFNIGTQGQMILGGLGTALTIIWLAPFVPGSLLGALFLVPFGVLVGAIIGGFWGFIPGVMKAYVDAHEVITTIMLNFVAIGITIFLVQNHVGDLTTGAVQTHSIPDFARLPATISGSRFSIVALLAGLAFVVGIYWLYERTVLGYDLRTSGIQPEAAEYSGVNAERNIVTSMTLSGALGGVAGAVYVLMVLFRWQNGMPPLGFDGIAVSILAGNNPVGVVPGALLFGVLKAGALEIDFALGVPKELVGVLRGLIILFVAMPELFRMLARQYGYGTPEVATDGGEQRG